jgi:transposase-like protein
MSKKSLVDKLVESITPNNRCCPYCYSDNYSLNESYGNYSNNQCSDCNSSFVEEIQSGQTFTPGGWFMSKVAKR